MGDDLKARIAEAFREKSKGDKKMFYIRDVTRWLPDEDRHAVQDAVKALIEDDIVRYWSTGSTTYLCLTEFYPEGTGLLIRKECDYDKALSPAGDRCPAGERGKDHAHRGPGRGPEEAQSAGYPLQERPGLHRCRLALARGGKSLP